MLYARQPIALASQPRIVVQHRPQSPDPQGWKLVSELTSFRMVAVQLELDRCSIADLEVTFLHVVLSEEPKAYDHLHART